MKKNKINESLLKNIEKIYGNDKSTIDIQEKRYSELVNLYSKTFSPDDKLSIISTPGRTELSGNHTDHNGGKVIAASINLDTLIAFSKDENGVRLKSDKYEELFHINLSNLNVNKNEEGTTNSLIRGIAADFVNRGYKIGGFKGVLTSQVIQGSGLSSSASIEVAIGSVFNFLYNNNEIPPHVIAQIGQFAENKYFGKPCGLMDQTACAIGGIVKIDFINNSKPLIHKVDFNLEDFNYKLLVIDTGGTHQNLTDDYAAIPIEMKKIASYFGKEKCIEISLNDLYENWNDLRKKVDDRSLLRAFHFLTENKRVELQIEALERKDLKNFLTLVKESGDSSHKYLQNIYSTQNAKVQPISLALAITEEFIMNIGEGACRIHGGGFAGTIQAFLPNKSVNKYIKLIEKLFGKNTVSPLSIRAFGSYVMMK